MLKLDESICRQGFIKKIALKKVKGAAPLNGMPKWKNVSLSDYLKYVQS